jgi:hypothetical protein
VQFWVYFANLRGDETESLGTVAAAVSVGLQQSRMINNEQEALAE